MRKICLSFVGFALAACAMPAHAQLVDTLVATGAGAGLDAQGGGVAMNVGNMAKSKLARINDSHNKQMNDAMGVGRGGGGGGRAGRSTGGASPFAAGASAQLGSPGVSNAPGASSTAAGGSSDHAPPLRWTPETGADMIAQLVQYGYGGSASSSSQRVVSRRVRVVRSRHHRTRRQYVTTVSYGSYSPNWVYHYLPADRYKVTSQDWQFVSTETDKYYYRPSASGMMRQPADRVIGFHTWQDAMKAGYRPDPSSKPEPGAQLAQIAQWTRGPHFLEFVEYTYAGEVNSGTMKVNCDYADRIAQVVDQKPYTRPYLADTLDQVFAASLGEGQMPTSIGPPRSEPTLAPASVGGLPQAGGGMPGGAPAGAPVAGATNPFGEQSNGSDKREDAYNKFGNRAGALSSTNR